MSRPDIFLSYNREDTERARHFAREFEASGFTVWWDVALRSGEAYDEVTETALRTARAVVVLWSKQSVVSRWVRAEATLADRNRTLVPAMIEDCERPIMFELTQTADLIHWQGDGKDPAWLAFIEDLRRFIGGGQSQRTPAPSAVNFGHDRPTVLVLPFINRSGEAEQEYFSDGVSEDIMTELGRVSGLDVISRTTAFACKGKVASSAELVEKLRISHILEGSVRKSGERVRISAQLLDARNDIGLWSERYDRDLDDIFALQDEISLEVAKALRLTLVPGAKRTPDRGDNQSGESYELFLLARQFERTGSERLKPSIVRLCERAVELDPGFARAWALMAQAKAELVQRDVAGFEIDDALANAYKAVELAPDLPEAQAALADVLMRGSNFEAAVEPTRRALELDPNCFEANVAAGFIAIGERRYDESIRHYEKAIELDPDAYRAAGMVVQAYAGNGDKEGLRRSSERAWELCERLIANEPDHGGALGFAVSALLGLGQTERARNLARRAEFLDPENLRLLYNLACAMVRVDVEAACDLLEKVTKRANSGWLRWMAVDNDLDPLRGTERFETLMREAEDRVRDAH